MMAYFVEYKNEGVWQHFLERWTVSTMQQTLQNETENCGGSTKQIRNHLQDKTLETLCFLRAYYGHT